MGNLRKFNTDDDYDNEVISLYGKKYHDVAYIEDADYVDYDSYEFMPLTFYILGNTNHTAGNTYNVQLVFDGEDASYKRDIKYRINYGDWLTGTFGSTTITGLNIGDTVQFYWNNDGGAYYVLDGSSVLSANKFMTNTKFMVFGDITSLNNYSRTYNPYEYACLFQDCTGLTSAKNLFFAPYITLADGCYVSMFQGCTNLIDAPELPATAASPYCYSTMFRGCTHLVTPPALPATSLGFACYSAMFSGCTSLTSAPELPATSLYSACYQNMFRGCTSLTTAPILRASTLNTDSYNSMFLGCSSLNRIECYATDISATRACSAWTSGVAASGVFVKDVNMEDWPTGANGIPNGWTVENHGEVSPVVDYWLKMYVDSYPRFDNQEEFQEFYETICEDLTEYCESISEDPDEIPGMNIFYWSGGTIQYDGETWYLWYSNDGSENYYCIITDTVDYDTLYDRSLRYTVPNPDGDPEGEWGEQPFILLKPDKSDVYPASSKTGSFVLPPWGYEMLKVIEIEPEE